MPEYEETLKRSSEDTEGLRTLMAELGFAGSDLKTVSFQVDPVYESVQDEHHNYKQQFVGYQFTLIQTIHFWGKYCMGWQMHPFLHSLS